MPVMFFPSANWRHGVRITTSHQFGHETFRNQSHRRQIHQDKNKCYLNWVLHLETVENDWILLDIIAIRWRVPKFIKTADVLRNGKEISCALCKGNKAILGHKAGPVIGMTKDKLSGMNGIRVRCTPIIKLRSRNMKDSEESEAATARNYCECLKAIISTRYNNSHE